MLALFGGAALLRPGQALAEWNQKAFTSKAVDEALASLGATNPEESSIFIRLTVPEIAENGAVVPVGVTSKVPGTQAVYILVEKNPNIIAAGFNIPAGTEANVSTRIKMGQSSNVIGLVKANNQYYMASKEVKVTLGGCGG